MPTMTESRRPPTRAIMGTGHRDTPVREIMAPGVLTISEDASPQQVHRTLAGHGVHSVLVVGRQEGRPLGWVTARGLLGWAESDATSIAAERDAPACVPPR